MKKVFTILASMLLTAGAFAQSSTWKTDASHSNVKFSVTHLVVSEVEGYFKTFAGTHDNLN